jgi:lysozyme family protein
MSTFEAAVEVLFKHEGGYSDDAQDAGGATKYGISAKSFPTLDIPNLTKDQALDIYRTLYWSPKYAEIHDQRLATELFEACVNMGATQAITLLQRAIQRAGGRCTVDGIFASKTLSAIYAVDAQELLDEYKTEEIIYYVKLAEAKPENKKFIRGWVKRAVA